MAATPYPNVRRFLAAPYNSLPDQMVERVVSAQGLEAGAIEDFWSDLGNVVSAALPIVGGVVGSIVPGVGTAIGAGLGAAGGAALHAAIGSGQQQPAPAAPPAPPAPGTSSSPYGTPYPYPYPSVAPPVMATSQQSAAQLLQLLTRPELLQALLQMLLGAAGSPTVPVAAAPAQAGAASSGSTAISAGSTAIPVSALTNLVSTLATQTSEAYNAEHAFTPSPGPFHYGASPWGSSVDLASNESRAAALMSLLRESGDGGAAARAARRQRLAGLAQALRAADDRRAS